jgi:Skp family chaperone for outer membrane proteins
VKPVAPPAVATVTKAPPAAVLFLDRETVIRQSAAGKSMFAQFNALMDKLEADMAPEAKKLQADYEALQQQSKSTPATALAPKVQDLQTRRAAFEKKVQERKAAIQAGVTKARVQLEQQLKPVLQKILVERSANLLLDRGLIVLGGVDADITSLVIQRLDVALPKLTVTPAAPSQQPQKPATP